MPRYVAAFMPQVWVGDYAYDAPPEGPVEWEPAQLSPELKARVDAHEYMVLDRDDELKQDTNAPEWIQNWSGPFSIYVSIVEE